MKPAKPAQASSADWKRYRATEAGRRLAEADLASALSDLRHEVTEELASVAACLGKEHLLQIAIANAPLGFNGKSDPRMIAEFVHQTMRRQIALEMLNDDAHRSALCSNK